MSQFLIGPVKDGLRKDVKPFAIPEDAFTILTNAYQWRGRVIRKPGYSLLGNLSNKTPVMGLRTRYLFGLEQQQLVAFDTTTAYYCAGIGSFPTLPTVMPTVWSGTDYQFFFTTNYADAFWATNGKSGFHGYALTNFAAPAGPPYTIDVTAAGNNFQVGDFVYFLNTDINVLRTGEVTVAGNPTFTVQETDGLGAFTAGVSGGYVLATNRSKTGEDGIRFYADVTAGASWVNYNPPIDTSTALMGALMIFAYRGYLVFLSTTEGTPAASATYSQRARWCQLGTPYYNDPAPIFPTVQTTDINTMRSDIFGRGDAIDAATQELIVGAEFVRDILVVYFEKSTWRLRFTYNAQDPFVWERVNRDFGAESTFATITFDKGIMSIGQRGIIMSDGNDTVRVDEKIPDDVFEIRQSNFGFDRVQGIRTFRTKLCYWTVPDISNTDGTYPDRVLVYNYDTKNWSYFDDCFTSFGYYYPSDDSDTTWNELTEPWSSYSDLTWGSGSQAQGVESVVAGNQQGYIFQLEQGNSTNDPSLYISAINTGTGVFTSPANNLPDGSWIQFTGITGVTNADGTDINDINYKIAVIDADTFTVQEYQPTTGGTATGATYQFQLGIPFFPVLAGSVNINIGALTFTDPNGDGVLTSGFAGNVGTINYQSGLINLSFSPSIAPTSVIIRVVSVNQTQELTNVDLTGAYVSGGQIIKISNFDIQTKFFNFFGSGQRTRLSRIDFYNDLVTSGQYTVNVFADSSDSPVNVPLPNNPQSNVVLTKPSQYQFGAGDETIYRLYCDATAQTFQLQLTMSDKQMAVSRINGSAMELLAMIVNARPGGRLI